MLKWMMTPRLSGAMSSRLSWVVTPRLKRLIILALICSFLAVLTWSLGDRAYYRASYERSQDLVEWLSHQHRALTYQLEQAQRDVNRMPYYTYLVEAYGTRFPSFSSILPIAYDAALRYRLDPFLVLSIIHVESNFNPAAVSRASCYGLMQLNPQAWPELDMARIYEPTYNIDQGCRIFKQYLEESGSDIALALYRYNNGYTRNGNTRYSGDVIGGKFNRGAGQ